MTKRHVFVPTADRWVSVDDGTVRDLDGTEMGWVWRESGRTTWRYRPAPDGPVTDIYATQATALAGLLSDPSCPTPGPNRYDRPTR